MGSRGGRAERVAACTLSCSLGSSENTTVFFYLCDWACHLRSMLLRCPVAPCCLRRASTLDKSRPPIYVIHCNDATCDSLPLVIT